MTAVQVELVGGGGGGSGGANISPYTGAGGGAGSYTRAIISVTPGSSVTYTVGAGGAGGIYAAGGGYPGGSGTQTTISSTNVTLKTNGGSGAGAYSASVDAQGGAGGIYTNTVTGNITSCLDVQGGDGYWIGNTACGGNGGCSYFGGPGKAAQVNVQSFNANNSAAYGAGGSGGRATSNSSAGANGAIIITYFTQSGLPNNYTASAPLSMSGTTLSIANATTSAPGVVQVGTGLSVSGSSMSSLASTSFGAFNLGAPPTNQFAIQKIPILSSACPSVTGALTYNSTTNYVTGLVSGAIYRINCGYLFNLSGVTNGYNVTISLQDGTGTTLLSNGFLIQNGGVGNPNTLGLNGYIQPMLTGAETTARIAFYAYNSGGSSYAYAGQVTIERFL